MKQEKVMLSSAIEWHEELEGKSVVDASIGPRGEICLLTIPENSGELDWPFIDEAGLKRIDCEVMIWKNGEKSRILVRRQKWAYHFVQLLGDDQILLVCARSRNYGNGKVDENARIFDYSGNLIGSFCMGDGIEHLAALEDGTIWAGYFDEGIFGNLGWDENPIGQSGLIRWDVNGQQLEKHTQSRKHFIMDCYAMNAVGRDEIWFYFYSDFHLARRKNGETEYFIPEIEGAHIFAVHENFLVFDGGYGGHDRFYLFQQNGSRFRCRKELVFVNETGKKLKPSVRYARGSRLLMQDGKESYVFDLKIYVEGQLREKVMD